MATTGSNRDVVIVGGGFAGVMAARELTMRGRSAVLVEARDRLGGRTYTSDHHGHAMELGGTWVHPLQPNVWAAINRYGVQTETFPVLEGLRQASYPAAGWWICRTTTWPRRSTRLTSSVRPA
jgi:monoamine oxidase